MQSTRRERPTIQFNLRAKQALVVGLLLLGLIGRPSVALANNVSDAAPPPPLGGGALLGIPLDGHQVYKMYLDAGDWIIGYAWSPGTRDATGTINVLGPSATDVASDTVATSSPGGILFWRAPSNGAYYCDFAAAPGSSVVRGLFLSRPRLTLSVSPRIIVPYKGPVTLSAVFTDLLYKYVPYDGTAVGFESIALKSGSGASWKQLSVGSSDVKGRVSFVVSGMKRLTTYKFDYDGAVYDSAGFGEALSRTVTIIPRFRVNARAPARVRRLRTFSVSGEIQPNRSAGMTNITAEAHKRGSRKIFKFPVRAYTPAGSTPIKAAVRLPSAGTWYVRFHCPTDASNAETVTKWVRVVVQ